MPPLPDLMLSNQSRSRTKENEVEEDRQGPAGQRLCEGSTAGGRDRSDHPHRPGGRRVPCPSLKHDGPPETRSSVKLPPHRHTEPRACSLTKASGTPSPVRSEERR